MEASKKDIIAPNDKRVDNILVSLVPDAEVDILKSHQLKKLMEQQATLEKNDRASGKSAEALLLESIQGHNDSPMAVLHRIRGTIRTLEGILTDEKKDYVAEREAIHGITRGRIAKILTALEAGSPVTEEEIKSSPSILGEVKGYLARQGITGRLSYEVALSTPIGESDKRCWRDRSRDIGKIFPRDLLQLVLRKRIRPGVPTHRDITTAGDTLYGQLNRNYCLEVLRQDFIRAGIVSPETLLPANYERTIEPIIAKSPFRSIVIVGRILKSSGCSYTRPKELLAKLLFGYVMQ